VAGAVPVHEEIGHGAVQQAVESHRVHDLDRFQNLWLVGGVLAEQLVGALVHGLLTGLVGLTIRVVGVVVLALGDAELAVEGGHAAPPVTLARAARARTSAFMTRRSRPSVCRGSAFASASS